MNATTAYKSQPSMYPFYYSAQPTLIDGLSDHHLSLIAPILAYWGLSLFFHILDISDWKWLDKYRIHESAEVKKRNLVSRKDVIIAVLFQQVVQTFLGLITLPSDDEQVVNHFERIQIYGNYSRPLVGLLLGKHATPLLLQNVGYWVYWWGIPAAQFVAAMFVIDTWQYFLHRAMHINKWMYRHFHSWHHRLYVPYAFGALYNHPIEGLALDTLSALVAQLTTGMNARQAALFFAFSTFKTIDDHCGYSLPFDPLQLMSGNNADYHDIHHQVIGIKSNFAQPFFVHWDTILGTRMTRAEMNARRKKNSAKIE